MAESRRKWNRDLLPFAKLAFLLALLLYGPIENLTGKYFAWLVLALLLVSCIALAVSLNRMHGYKDKVDVVYRKKNTTPEQKHN